MTPKQEAAMRLALEALEVATTPLAKDRQEVLRARAAIREALAEQPAQPCGYPYCGCNSKAWCKLERMAENARELGLDYEPPCKTGSQCTNKCQQCEQPAQQQEPNKDGSPCPEFWDWLPKAYNFEGAGNFTKYNMEVAFLAGKQSVSTQEPVAWMDGYRNIYSLEEKAAGCPEATIALVPMANHKKTSGSPINEIQCVCGAVWLGEEMVHLPDKRPPASKPWVGLTDEEKSDLWCESTGRDCVNEDTHVFADSIEAKLRKKNQ